MNFAAEITARLTMPGIYAQYGFELNRAGFICCPFHAEKTPSLKYYADGKRWKCFGCGEGGSVIDFVMRLFSMSFNEAAAKLNSDFCLGLPIGEKPSYRSKIKQIEAGRKYKTEQKQRAMAAEEIESGYWNAFDEWLKWSFVKEEYAPKTQGEHPRPIFFTALHRLSAAEAELDERELIRIGFGRDGEGNSCSGIHPG